MTINYPVILLLALISGMTTFIGAWLAVCCRNNNKTIVAGIGFSTGIMLLISFFELIPEALKQTPLQNVLLSSLAGFVLLALLNFILPHSHLIKENEKTNGSLYKIAYLVAIGLILHDFPEGFAMANSYVLAPKLGILIAVAIALHNIPEEFAMATPIVVLNDKKFLYKAAFISGLAEPAGAVIGLIGITIIPSLTPIFLSFAAGAMIFVSLHELIPFANRYKMPLYFINGIILSILVFLILRFSLSS